MGSYVMPATSGTMLAAAARRLPQTCIAKARCNERQNHTTNAEAEQSDANTSQRFPRRQSQAEAYITNGRLVKETGHRPTQSQTQQRTHLRLYISITVPRPLQPHHDGRITFFPRALGIRAHTGGRSASGFSILPRRSHEEAQRPGRHSHEERGSVLRTLHDVQPFGKPDLYIATWHQPQSGPATGLIVVVFWGDMAVDGGKVWLGGTQGGILRDGVISRPRASHVSGWTSERTWRPAPRYLRTCRKAKKKGAERATGLRGLVDQQKPLN